MLVVPVSFIVATVLHISDAHSAPTPRLKALITTASELIDETIRLLPSGIPPMIALLEEANSDLKQFLDSNETQGRFTFLRSALENDIEGLSTVVVLCGEPQTTCQKAAINLAIVTVKIVAAVIDICEERRDAIDKIYMKVLSRHGASFELEMWEIGRNVLTVIENGC